MLFSLSYFYWEHKLSSELADMRTGGTGGTDSLPMTLEIFTTNNLKIIRSLKDSHIISTRSDYKPSFLVVPYCPIISTIVD